MSIYADLTAKALGVPKFAVTDGVLPPLMSPRPRRQGGVGTQIWGGSIDDDDQNEDLRNEKWYGEPGDIGIARKMERDAHVRQSFATKRAPLIAASWDFEPASKSPLDLEIADFVKYCLFDVSNWEKFLYYATLYMRDGFSLIEMTDDVRPIPQDRFKNHKGRGFGIIPTGFYHIPAWTVYEWNQKKTNPNQLQSIKQWIVGSDVEDGKWQTVNSRRFLRFTMDQEGANFAGLSYFRSAYGPWKICLMLQVLDSIRHERHGVKIPTMTLPEEAGDDEFDQAQEILSEMRAHHKGYLVLPNGFTFEWSGSDGDGTNINEAIERCHRDIAYNMASGFMLLGLTGSTGSYALAQSQRGQYEIQLDTDAKFIANTVNLGSDGWSIVDRLVTLNYGPNVARPRLIARNMPTRDWSKILPIVHNLTVSKNITPSPETEAFIRKVTYMPPLENEYEDLAMKLRNNSTVSNEPEEMDVEDEGEEVDEQKTKEENTEEE